MRRVLATLLLAGALAHPASAQQAGTPSPARMAAARELLAVLDMPAVIDATVELELKSELERNPELVPVQDVLRSFFGKYMSWAAIGEHMATIYAEAFSEAELHDLLTFYRTPTGRKAARISPQLMQRGGELGQRMVQEHLPELEEMMSAALERAGQKP